MGAGRGRTHAQFGGAGADHHVATLAVQDHRRLTHGRDPHPRQDGGRYVGADFFAKLGGASGAETLKQPVSVTVVRVTKAFKGTSRTDVTDEFFDPAELAQVAPRSTVTPGAADLAAEPLGVVRKLREPVVGARAGTTYDIRFEATVEPGDATENVVGTLIVDQTGRAG